MKIPFKYGLFITVGVIAWILAVRAIFTNPQSVVHTLGTPIIFNVLHFTMIFLGLKALEHSLGDKPTFKQGLKTGVGISFVYALTTSLFFVAALAIVGTKWLASEPGAADLPVMRVALSAFAFLFVSAMVFGLIYSTVISFFVAKRISATDERG
jgi:hypothetical protein